MDSSSSTGHTVAGIVDELDGAKRQCHDGAMHQAGGHGGRPYHRDRTG